jgi:UDP-3-O-[3-hydroxymyristoyl] N-acetylglucosamine deacetylase
MTHALLKALFARPMAFRMVTLSEADAARLPGAGVTRGDLPRVA